MEGLRFEFTGDIWHWRGPAPFHFVTVPEDASAQIRDLATVLSYGWGVIPVRARIGDTEWTTSLFPKDGGYALPVKDAVRRAEQLAEGSVVSVIMEPTRSP
ncbi:DUF1905 domain-containing protein [Microlunatus sp. GCM10028923]|uniref:DUF1905 domain-containing protein n=1 Tax=Microlunatus sp. GCM10028923 TaxID=3273400 RepID=UPI00361C3019